MEHLNYCRQAVKALLKSKRPHDRLAIIRRMNAATKFLLPEWGETIDDPQLRGLDREIGINLPHAQIALEYAASTQKNILLARQDGEFIIMQMLIQLGWDSTWYTTGEMVMSRQDWRTAFPDGTAWPLVIPRDAEDDIPQELLDEAGCRLSSFLNALACANVHAERREPRAGAKLKKGALPFDAYHVLTIDVGAGESKPILSGLGAIGHHRSPREHMRRGHIRKLPDGRRIWVNATLVNAGSGGSITKDYALRDRSTATQALA